MFNLTFHDILQVIGRDICPPCNHKKIPYLNRYRLCKTADFHLDQGGQDINKQINCCKLNGEYSSGWTCLSIISPIDVLWDWNLGNLVSSDVFMFLRPFLYNICIVLLKDVTVIIDEKGVYLVFNDVEVGVIWQSPFHIDDRIQAFFTEHCRNHQTHFSTAHSDTIASLW